MEEAYFPNGLKVNDNITTKSKNNDLHTVNKSEDTEIITKPQNQAHRKIVIAGNCCLTTLRKRFIKKSPSESTK